MRSTIRHLGQPAALGVALFVAMSQGGCPGASGVASFVKYTPDSTCVVFNDEERNVSYLYCLSSQKLAKLDGWFEAEDEVGHRWVVGGKLVRLTGQGDFEISKLPEYPAYPHLLEFGPGSQELTLFCQMMDKPPTAYRLDLRTWKYEKVDDAEELAALAARREAFEVRQIDTFDRLAISDYCYSEYRGIRAMSRNVRVIRHDRSQDSTDCQFELPAPNGETVVAITIQRHKGLFIHTVHDECGVEITTLIDGRTRKLAENETGGGEVLMDGIVGPITWPFAMLIWLLAGAPYA